VAAHLAAKLHPRTAQQGLAEAAFPDEVEVLLARLGWKVVIPHLQEFRRGDALQAVLHGLRGGSTDSKHKDEINVLSFSQSVSGSGCPEFSISKPVDPASPGLAEAASSQRPFTTANLVVRKNGDKGFEYYKVAMSSVYVLSSNQSFSNEGAGYEEVVLSSRTTSMSYTPQKPDGSTGTEISRTINCSSPGSRGGRGN
jgi:type VI secretion system secreted protein Hcp